MMKCFAFNGSTLFYHCSVFSSMRVMTFGTVCISDILMYFILKHKAGTMAIKTQLLAFSFKQFFIIC